MVADIIVLLFMILMVVFVVFVFFAVFTILRKFSDWRISKNNEKYFKLNEKICNKNKITGQKMFELYKIYYNLIREFNLNRTIKCSSVVASSATNNLTKYLMKYSNIDSDVDDMEKLDFMLNFMRNYKKFKKEMSEVGYKIKKTIPIFYRIFATKEKIPYIVCGLDCSLIGIEDPYLTFLYISPAGRSRIENKLWMNVSVIKGIMNEISKSVGKRSHSRHQRNIMTNDLREAIKKRDNYTCCKCGNNVYEEPNLLLEVDHIIPISKGGKTEASNLQTLCWRCNRAKSNKIK